MVHALPAVFANYSGEGANLLIGDDSFFCRPVRISPGESQSEEGGSEDLAWDIWSGTGGSWCFDSNDRTPDAWLAQGRIFGVGNSMQKTALVTGGTRGIGSAISLGLKEAGYQVAANYAGNEEKAKAFEDETGIRTFKWDVADFAACQDGIAAVEAALGPVDILVNNAGITRDTPLHKMSLEQWNDVINVDLDSLFNMSRNVIEGMRDRNFGRIINVSSINGQKGQAGQTNYSAAKAGVIGFSKALAQETAKKGITVNVICPGYIDTDMVRAVPENVLEQIVNGVPAKRLGKAEEIAQTVVFVASESAGYMTGATLTVNGGQYMI